MSDWIDNIVAIQEYVKSLHEQILKRSEVQPGELDQDRFLSSYNRLLRRSPQERIFSGRVTDALPYQNWYRVFLDDMIAPIVCTALAPTGTFAFGTRWHCPLPIGSRVVVYYPPNSIYGLILGTEPFLRSPNGVSFSDFVSLQSAHSPYLEPSRAAVMELSKGREILNWSSDRPYDACGVGETGIFSETGTGVFVDSAMAYLRASESCGIWAFYADDLLRLSGTHWQLRTGLGEEEHIQDEGELWGHRGVCAYPWELLGAHQFGQTVSRAYPEDHPVYRPLEPFYDDQASFYRYEEYYGYAANLGYRRQVNVRLFPQSPYRLTQPETNATVFCEQVHGDGTYWLSSSRGISFVKRFLQPMPHRQRRPESPAGDRGENYRFSGYFGSGPIHRLRQAQAEDPLARMQQTLDYLTYVANWQNLVAFHYHHQDYSVPEESTLANLTSATVDQTGFSVLQRRFALPFPPATSLPVDHRFGSVPYYQNTAYISISEDGGIALSDGYGSEIVLSGGHIYLRCPGDIHLQAGRRIVQLSGGDVIVRAREHCEVSTTLYDVRVSSGRHSYYHSSGGTLIQSDSIGYDLTDFPEKVGSDCRPVGITLRSINSGIQTYSSLLYTYTSGPTYLDCSRGQASFSVSARQAFYYLSDAFGIVLGAEEDQKVHLFAKTTSRIDSDIAVQGSLTVLGSGTFEDWLFSTDGHVATNLSDRYDHKILPLTTDEGDSQILVSLRERLEDIRDAQQEVQQSVDSVRSSLEPVLFADGRAGSDRVIQYGAFSFRTTRQYQTQDYLLPESRWQMVSRLQGEAVPIWQERVVDNAFSQTCPFPGLERIQSQGSFRVWSPSLLSHATGVAIDRSEVAYVDSPWSDGQSGILMSDYRVIGVSDYGEETGNR